MFKQGFWIGLAILLVIAIASIGSVLETNRAGYYQIKQAAMSGEMTVRSTPGVYPQMFGAIHDYMISDMLHFSKNDVDGGSGDLAQAINVRFNDGGTADVSGAIKFRLSMKKDNQLKLHQDFRSYNAVKFDLVRQVVTAALIQTATLMKAEESYSTRRSEFMMLAEEQIKNGIMETVSREFKEKDPDGNEFIIKSVNAKKNEDGSYVIRKASPFLSYDIEILQFVIKEIDFDRTIDALIAKKKEAEQAKVVAKSNAERAKQDAITATEQGKMEVAKAKATELVLKIKAVTDAQKKFEVSKLERMRAEEDSKAVLVRKRAQATANQLLVKAGLTPDMRAKIDKETAIGVAAELAKVQFPRLLVIGGSGGNSPMNPFDAVGLKSFIDISNDIAKQKK